jgi:hypothetical protein
MHNYVITLVNYAWVIKGTVERELKGTILGLMDIDKLYNRQEFFLFKRKPLQEEHKSTGFIILDKLAQSCKLGCRRTFIADFWL